MEHARMHLGVEVRLEGVDQHDRIVELAVQPRRAHLLRVRARVYIGVGLGIGLGSTLGLGLGLGFAVPLRGAHRLCFE